MERFITFAFGVAGSVIIGLHFGSGLLGVGVYFCIIAAGTWR